MANDLTESAILEYFKELQKLELLDIGFVFNDQNKKQRLREENY